jgi:pimeloyl-ACP methyl ester carboxylesterase
VLLIHGGLGTLRMWDEHVARFAARHRVIRYDTRGFGRTETDDVEFANRDDAIAVLDHLGLGSASVVGQSRGAMIALDLALDRADRVDALVSVAGGIGGYEPELADGTSQPPWDALERLWEKKDWPALAELETQVWVDGWGQPEGRVDPEVRSQVREWILAGYEAGNTEGRPVPMGPPRSSASTSSTCRRLCSLVQRTSRALSRQAGDSGKRGARNSSSSRTSHT